MVRFTPAGVKRGVVTPPRASSTRDMRFLLEYFHHYTLRSVALNQKEGIIDEDITPFGAFWGESAKKDIIILRHDGHHAVELLPRQRHNHFTLSLFTFIIIII